MYTTHKAIDVLVIDHMRSKRGIFDASEESTIHLSTYIHHNCFTSRIKYSTITSSNSRKASCCPYFIFIFGHSYVPSDGTSVFQGTHDIKFVVYNCVGVFHIGKGSLSLCIKWVCACVCIPRIEKRSNLRQLICTHSV